MTLDLDVVLHRGQAAVVLRHYDLDQDGHPVLAVGEPAEILALRQKIRKFLEQLSEDAPKAKPKAKAVPRKKAAAKKEKAAPAPQKETQEEETPEIEEKGGRTRVPNLTEEKEKQIMDLVREGRAYSEVAEIVGCTKGQVIRFLKREKVLQ